MRGPSKTAQLQLYSSVLGGGEDSISARSTLRADSQRAEAAVTQMSSHTRDITQLEWTERAELQDSNVHLRVRFEAPFLSPNVWQAQHCSFQMSLKVCSNAAILSVRASQPRVKLWIKHRERLTWGGSTQEEGGKRRTPRTVIGALSTHREAESKNSPACPTSSCKDAGLSFPLSPAFKISSNVTFHWIHLQL